MPNAVAQLWASKKYHFCRKHRTSQRQRSRYRHHPPLTFCIRGEKGDGGLGHLAQAFFLLGCWGAGEILSRTAGSPSELLFTKELSPDKVTLGVLRRGRWLIRRQVERERRLLPLCQDATAWRWKQSNLAWARFATVPASGLFLLVGLRLLGGKLHGIWRVHQGQGCRVLTHEAALFVHCSPVRARGLQEVEVRI